jgi:hypothetical protein
VLIYSHTITPRIQYVVDFLSQYYRQPFRVTTDWQYFQQTEKPKLNYSATNADEQVLWVQPQGLLAATGIKEITVTCFDHPNGYKAFFKTEGTLGFDLFAAIFYLLSRYEEYRPHQKDMYGRYAHENSLAYKNNFLHLPLINIWLEDFRKIINDRYSTFCILHSTFQFLPTYDIDIAWSYRNKGLLRNAGGAVRSIVKGQWSMVKERVRVLTGREQDPFDSYEWLDSLHQQYNLQPLYFFHVGQRRTAYDKNIATSNNAFQTLVKQHADRYSIGVHPSWHSGDAPANVKREKEVLEKISGQPITASRQHYIRFTVPQTFRHLIAVGITSDYSMGYGSVNGFRASVATSFYWYDLEKEEKTNLLLHPFCFMDANSFFEQRLTPEQALQELLQYYHIVKQVNGLFITIWHNNFLGTDSLYKGWREVYEQFIKLVATG